MIRITAAALLLGINALSLTAQAQTLPEQPMGHDGNPYIDGGGGLISNLAELRWLSETPSAWDESWLQTQDIDASETKNWNLGDHDLLPETPDEPMGFSPIGDNSIAYNGSFNGGGFKIHGLYINRPQSDNIGFFGNLTAGTLAHINLERLYITGDYYVGGLAGNVMQSSIVDCHTSGEVKSVGRLDSDVYPDEKPGSYLGGMIGYANHPTIEHCSSTALVTMTLNNPGITQPTGGLIGQLSGGEVTASRTEGDVHGYSSTGGFIGSTFGTPIIKNSSAHGNVICESNCGGLVGYAYGGQIEDSFAAGDVASDNIYVGGLVGGLYNASILRANASGQVLTTSWGVGGLVGRCDSDPDKPLSSIIDSYATGKVSGNTSGALIGVTWDGCHVSNSYATGFNSQLFGTTMGIEPVIDNSFFDCGDSDANCSQAYAKTTAELQNLQTFIDAGWNMGSYNQAGTWLLNHNSYPILSHGKAALFTTLSEDIQLQGSEDLLYELTLQVEDIPANQHVAFEVIDAPAWLSLQTQGITASLSGTADDSGVGDNIVIIAAVNQGVRNDFPLQLVNIANINDQPIASSAQLEAVEDTLLSVDLSTFVKDDDFIHGDEQHSFSILTPLPDGHGNIEIVEQHAHYTPAVNFFGSTKFMYQVTDIAGVISSAWVDINVAPVNDAPTAHNGQIIVNEDGVINLDLNTLVQDVDNKELIFSVADAQHGQLSLQGSVVTYQPNSNYFGSDSFSYSVDDKQSKMRLIANAQVSVAVLPINDAPTAQSANYQTAEDSSIQIDLSSLVADIDSEILSFELASQPTNASIVLVGSGVTVTPNADFNGALSFSYRVHDTAGGQANAIINIEVTPTNDAPIAQNIQLPVQEDQYVTINLASIVQDKDNDPLSFTIGQALHGKVSLSGTTANYQPDKDYAGNDMFNYQVSDGITTASGQVLLSIQNINDAPTITGAPPTEVELGNRYQFTPKVHDVEGDNLSFSINNKPSWANFNQRTGELSGTPTDEQDLGTYQHITIQVSDKIDTSALASFDIEVTGEAEADIAVDDSFNLPANKQERYVLEVLANDKVNQGDVLTLTGANTNNAKVSINGAQLIVELTQPLTALKLSYFVENQDKQQDSANVLLTIERETDNSLPVITPTEPIWINASGALSEVAFKAPDAFDAEGNPLIATRTDNQTYFTPGRHQIQWQATDEQGNQVSTEQQLNIHPQVSLPRTAQVQALGYELYSVKFHLNGEAPQYPVTVEYTLTDEINNVTTEESVLIESGTTASVDLLLSNANNATSQPLLAYSVQLASSVNQSKNNLFSLYVQAAPQPPIIASQLTQNSQKRAMIALPVPPNTAEEVQIALWVENALEGEQFNFEWHSDVIELSVTDQLSSTHASFIPQASMPTGVHKIYVDVTRTGEKTSRQHHTRHELYLDIRDELPELSAVNDTDGDGIPDKLEGFTDSDQDGIPDYQDAINVANLMPATVNEQSSHLIEVNPGLTLKKGLTVSDNQGGGLLLDPEKDDISLDTNKPVIGGIFDFIIQGLQVPGESVAIVLPQINPIPANASYLKYQAQTQEKGRWVEFDHSAGAVFSALGKPGICPAPDAPIWTSGLTRGDWCVKLIIIDGGANDADGIANGTVVDPGGVAISLGDNTLPVLIDDNFSFFDDVKSVTLDVLANDTDAEDPLSIINATASHGVISHDGQELLLTLPDTVPEQIDIQYTVIELRENGVTQLANAKVNFKQRPVVKDSGSLSYLWIAVLVMLVFLRRQTKYRSR